MKSGKINTYLPKKQEKKVRYEEEIEVEDIFKRYKEDIFEDIIGYDKIKDFITRAIKSKKPISILLIGPPACAKSMFLEAFERLGARLFTGSKTSSSGLLQALVDERLNFILYDEMEKSDLKDLTPLLTWIPDGRIVVDLKNDKINYKIDSNKWMCIAAVNSTRKLSRELLSRFEKFYFPEYSKYEFENVIIKMLKRRDNIAEIVSKSIASHLISNVEFDIREALRIASLIDVDESIEEQLIAVNSIYSTKKQYSYRS